MPVLSEVKLPTASRLINGD